MDCWVKPGKDDDGNTVAEGWHAGPQIEKAGRWTVEELDARLPALVRQAAANALTSGEIPQA